MSENNDFLRTSNGSFRLRADVTSLMLKGAGYAALFCLALLIMGWIVVGIGRLLPDASKEAPDPTPWSFLMQSDVDTDVA
jgi:hypothetical protein